MLVPERLLGCGRRGGAGAASGVLRVLLPGVVCVLTLVAAAQAGYDEGRAAYDAGDYATALPEFLLAAQDGDARAQNMVGLIYDLGRGVPENDAVAVRWYRLAAGQGYASAEYNLGLMYQNGTGVERNLEEAKRWYRLAAAQDHQKSKERLAQLEAGTTLKVERPESETQPTTTSVPVFDPAKLLQQLEETSFETIDLLPPFAAMGRGEVLPERSKSRGLQARVRFENDRINGIVYDVYDTPQAARRGFELRAEVYREGEAGVQAELFRTVWKDYGDRGVDIHAFCAHEPLPQDPPPDTLRCAVLDPDRQVVIETLAQEPLSDTEMRDLMVKASLVALDRALTVLGDIFVDLEPVDEIDLPAYDPDAGEPKLRDPVAIVTALTEQPKALADLTARLRDRPNFKTPFQAPRSQSFEDANPADREHGVESYIVFVMDDSDWHSGVEFVVYRDSQAAESDLVYQLATPESWGDDGVSNVQGSHSEYRSDGGERLNFICGRAAEVDGGKPSEQRCAYHPPGSQISVIVYAYAPEPFFEDDNDKDFVGVRMATVLVEAVEVALAIERSLPAASPGPSAETLRQLDDLVARIDREIAGTADFVYSDGGYGLTKRLLLNDGVALDGTSRLRVERRACLALLTTDMAQGNECRQEPLFKPYGLEIDLTRLEPATTAIEADNGRSGVQGWSLRFACAGDSLCARVTADDFQAQVIAKGFEETLDRPNLLLHCESQDQCAALADAMRKLIALAPNDGGAQEVRLQPEPQPQPVGETLVGVWQLPGIGKLEFRADGTYRFEHPTLGHAGTYTAQNGVWSQTSKTPTMPWEDGGTYKLLDPDRLELVGKLGGAVWQRLGPQ